MKHFPANPARTPVRIEGIEYARADTVRRSTAVILFLFFYAGGFFTGAILIGEALLRLHSQ